VVQRIRAGILEHVFDAMSYLSRLLPNSAGTFLYSNMPFLDYMGGSRLALGILITLIYLSIEAYYWRETHHNENRKIMKKVNKKIHGRYYMLVL